jgi:glutaminyl-peptide cyclotransferase
MRKRLLWLLYATSTLYVISCKEEAPKPPSPSTTEQAAIVQNVTPNVVGQLPHDVASFTEGLLFYENKMYESTGSPEEIASTRSVIGPVDMKTGKIDIKAEIDRKKYFGEGIVFLKGKLYQLTYKNQMAFIYDAKTFKKIGEFKYANAEGWGLTTDGISLIMSDGTDKITYLDAESYKPTKTLNVTAYGKPLMYLNELEYVNGYIYANVWTTNFIVKIDPASGKVLAKIDCTAIAADARSKNPRIAEMNGVAYNPITSQFYLTGKFWPNIYIVSIPQ